MKRFAIGLCLCIITSHAQTKSEKSRDAAAILDRYAAVTGGAPAYHKYAVEIVDVTITPEGGKSYGVTIFRSRDGRRRTEMDAVAASEQSGIYNGTVWEFSREREARES